MVSVKVIFGLLIVAGLSFGGWHIYQAGLWQVDEIHQPKLAFQYHQNMKVTKLSAEPKSGDTVLSIAQAGRAKVEFQIEVVYETGISLAAGFARQEPKQMLITNAQRVLPTKFANYEKVAQTSRAIGAKQAESIEFVYQGPSGGKIRQEFLILLLDGDRALYISAQAKDAEYQAVKTKYFSKFLDSLELQ